MTKKSRQKPKYVENENSFQGEIKSIFISFKGISVAKNVSDLQKILATDPIKTASRWAIQRNAEAIGNLISNKIVDKITRVTKSLTQNNPETVESKTKSTKFDREMPKVRYISAEKR